MNAIIVIKNGIMETPNLVKNNHTAKATYLALVEKEGVILDTGDIISDSLCNEVDRQLKGSGVEIQWFEDIEINNFK